MKREEYDPPELYDKIIRNANLFYNGHSPEISDFEYDDGLRELMRQNPSFSIYDYITYEEQFKRVPHTVKFPNFEKVDFNRLQLECNDSDIVLTCKYDGGSCIALYSETGELQNILTRSNEVDGIVQTEKLRKKVPQRVNPDVRGILFECTVDISEGNRSASNGLLNSKYKQEDVDSKLFVNFFDVILRKRALGYEQRMQLAGVPYNTFTVQGAMKLKEMGDEPYVEVEREGKVRKIPVDGIVAYSNVDPLYGRIYKFYSTQYKITTVKKLTFDPSSETGINNIVVEFEPVKIGAITIKRCGNAGSWKTIKDKKLGVGSQVEVYLTKVTIPAIASNTPWTEEPKPKCPWCGHELSEFQGKLVCKNLDCTFWEDFFETRYFNILREHVGKEWVDEFTVNGKFDIEMMAKAEIKTGYTLSRFITQSKYMYYLLKPPRVNGKTYDNIRLAVQQAYEDEPPKDTFELADIVLNQLQNANQREYSEMVWDKLMHFLRKEAKVRKDLKAKGYN